MNDVTAMKGADVAVALLNGFGDENDFVSDGEDEDNKRRKSKLLSRPLGSNKKKSSSASKESNDRVKQEIEEAQANIRKRVAERTGQSVNATDLKYEMSDLKDMISATMNAVKAESQRARSLKTGGAEAARILAEERRNSEGKANETSLLVVEDVEETIKPGEASLVASFSCLHPSIDGVDSVLRAGVATAASALATQEMIALHSLMSCYHLATLYRDGFRYGKNMWPVELFMYSIVDNARYKASCTSRPRLPHSASLRPQISLFSPASLFSTLSQAGIHLLTMALGVDYARKLEIQSGTTSRRSIRLSEGPHSPKLSKFLEALAATEAASDDDTGASLFRRPPFQPNYETNMVFLLSILQSAISSLVNHKGKPFYRSLLESRELCFASVLTAFLIVILVVESFPMLNNVLQLKSLPSNESKLVFLGIAAANTVGCIFSRTIVDALTARHQRLGAPTAKKEKEILVSEKDTDEELAADLEERLLTEESGQNLRTILLALGSLTYLSLDILTKT